MRLSFALYGSQSMIIAWLQKYAREVTDTSEIALIAIVASGCDNANL